MQCLRCLRITASTNVYPNLGAVLRVQHAIGSATRSLSTFSPIIRRPTIFPSTATTLISRATTLPGQLAVWNPTTAPQSLAIQLRTAKRDTYNPSHVVRKRRHGYLSRIRTRLGRRTLMRRRKKGRTYLSH